MSDRCKVEFYAELIVEGVELLRGEVAAVIGEDAMWHAKATNDAFEEVDGSSSELVRDGYSFNPLGEFIDCNQQVCMATR